MSKKEDKIKKKSKSSPKDIADAFAGIDMSAYAKIADAFAGIDMSLYENIANEISRMLGACLKLAPKLPALSKEPRLAVQGLKILDNWQRDYDVILTSPVLLDLPGSKRSEVERLRQENKRLKQELEKATAAMKVKPLEDDRDYQ